MADLCGVSRGTVDRVLNNRGKVKKETEIKVKQIAEQLGYTPNIAAKQLVAKKNPLTIGVLLIAEGNSFFDDVIRGVQRAEKELKDYGVTVILQTMKGYNVQRQIQLMEEMRPHINALIINPISSVIITNKINELVEEGLCVITINTDIRESKRLCYIGSNYTKCGETACGILGLLTGGKANIGILTGSKKVAGHNQRVKGFKTICNKKYPEFRIIGYEETEDDDIRAFEVTNKLLNEHPNIDAIFVVAAGVYGVCRALISSEKAGKIKLITCDSIPTTVEMMKQGVISATICQQPFTQGNKSVHTAFNYLVSGIEPEKKEFIVKSEIKILENL
nr:LacI family DNA-binding transcriptional regulator [uncultured Niameybacter sp.]